MYMRRREDEAREGAKILGAIMLALFMLVLWFSPANAEGLRLEAGIGLSHHKLAPEGSWWYEGFEQDTKLTTPTWQLGLAYFKNGWGIRGGYTDLGTVKASNQFPVVEDHSSADARVDPNCNRQTLAGCTGQFTGRGPTKGWYVGPAYEHRFGSFTYGAEFGVFRYSAKWVATNWTVVDAQGEFTPAQWSGFEWNEVDKWHTTWYAGGNLRWKDLFLQARRYAAVHAANTDKGSAFIGMTSGPVWTVLAGISVDLQ